MEKGCSRVSEPAKICDGKNCESPAVVYVKQIVGGKASDYCYCRACAEKKGISTGASQEFEAPASAAPLEDETRVSTATCPPGPCSFCGLTWDAFKQSGRLGCPECYAAFEPNLRSLLRRVHGAALHAGKVYLPPDPAGVDIDRRIGTLRRRLRRAVEAEDFETAAQLRDRILEMEPAE